MPGTKYNETPDKVWRRHNAPPEPLPAITLKDAQNQPKIDQLRVLATQLSCDAVTIDELGQVRVRMYSGRNYEYGYEFFDRGDARSNMEGDYVVIPGEEHWVAYRR